MGAVLWWAALIVGFLLPYSRINAWNFIPAFGVILICARSLRGWKAREWLGIALSRRELARTLAWSAGLALTFRFALLQLAAEAGLRFDASAWSPLLRTRPVFQVLNEEMLFRAVLLRELGRTGASAWKLSLGSAIFFALSHILFYWLKDGIWLQPVALWNLLVFSVACNSLFLHYGHIGYGYAIHVGWNLTRFGGDFFRGSTLLSEGTAFNVLEGSPWFSLLITPATAILLVILGRTSAQRISS